MQDSKRDTDVNRLLDSVGEGEGGMIGENSIETHILPYMKQITSPGSMREAGHSGPVPWDDPEGWDGQKKKQYTMKKRKSLQQMMLGKLEQIHVKE